MDLRLPSAAMLALACTAPAATPCDQARGHLLACAGEVPLDFDAACEADPAGVVQEAMALECADLAALADLDEGDKSGGPDPCWFNWNCQGVWCSIRRNCDVCRRASSHATGERRCLPPGREGEPCDPGDAADCAAGLTCRPEVNQSGGIRNLRGRLSLCQRPGREFDACLTAGVSEECAPGLACVSRWRQHDWGWTGDWGARECRRLFPVCHHCHYDEDCGSGWCADNSFNGFDSGRCCDSVQCANRPNEWCR